MVTFIFQKVPLELVSKMMMFAIHGMMIVIHVSVQVVNTTLLMNIATCLVVEMMYTMYQDSKTSLTVHKAAPIQNIFATHILKVVNIKVDSMDSDAEKEMHQHVPIKSQKTTFAQSILNFNNILNYL